ncbi:MAG: hypothetical protein Ct9H300mP19_19120 [Dehalococcoidia bacterium]|nr:MAG: hypothetical protein Ct9H300mP19_19120 [Dehalococcoidia bacterium]
MSNSNPSEPTKQIKYLRLNTHIEAETGSSQITRLGREASHELFQFFGVGHPKLMGKQPKLVLAQTDLLKHLLNALVSTLPIQWLNDPMALEQYPGHAI